MKLRFNEMGQAQPDPFVIEDNGSFYLYTIESAASNHGVTVYESRALDGEWIYRGIVTDFADAHTFWAPSVIKLEDKFYMYVSCVTKAGRQFMHVACSTSPTGPFQNPKCLYDHFSIDSHMVKTDAGLFLWYAKDNTACERIGTRVYVDRFIDPYTPENDPKEVLVPEFDEEKYTPKCKDGKTWYTVEGPFWFQEGDWQYLMYSAGCYQDDTYHVGYAVAKTNEQDLKKVEFQKVKRDGGFCPLLIKNELEEGTGHNSVIKFNNEYYAFYHGRDYEADAPSENPTAYVEKRTARICKLLVKDGVLAVENL